MTALSSRWQCCMPLKCSATTTASPRVQWGVGVEGDIHYIQRTAFIHVLWGKCSVKVTVGGLNKNSLCFHLSADKTLGGYVPQ